MNKILHNRKFILLIACLSLVLLLDLMQDTYAKYISSADANSNLSIAHWAFLVNDQDVLNNNDFSTTILPEYDANSHISSGVIAPTSTGHFEVEIDSSNVGVSFDEVITLSHADDNTVGDIVFTGYKKNNDSVVSFQENSTTASISSTHLLGSGTTVDTYIFYIKWNDNASTETMDNEDDTAAAASGTAAINVNVQFIQRASSSSPSSGTTSTPSSPSGD